MVKVKICGITNIEDAIKACDYGADFVGFIFIKGTPRYIESPEDVLSNLPEIQKSKTEKVGLFKDEKLEEVVAIVARYNLDCVQLHGEEKPSYCRGLKETLKKDHNLSIKIIKAFKVSDRILPHGEYGLGDYEDADYFVFDTFHPETDGGTGIKFDRNVLVREKPSIGKPFFVAGGLTPGNISDVVKEMHPYGVDVSSGVECVTGKKDEKLLKEFINNAKEV